MGKLFNNILFEAFANAAENIYVYVCDFNTGKARWSENAVAFFGLDNAYMDNTLTTWSKYIHPDDLHVYLDDIAKLHSGEKNIHDCQYRARNRYGEYVWVECKGSLVYDEDTQTTLLAGFVTRIDNQSKYDNMTHLLTGFELMHYPFEKPGAIMLTGIDGFRNINSQYGIIYGNKVISRMARILADNAPKGYVVYRFQGNEFAVLGEGMTSEDMTKLFNVVSKECSQPDDKTGITSFGISAGIVDFNGDEGVTRIMSGAELCLNFAKKNQVTHYEIYSPEIEKKQSRRNLVSEALFESINNNFEGFYLVYQPILANSGDKIIACESLIRWKSPNSEVGPCYPDEFISILESNGGINEVGYFVMREAIKQASIWQKSYEKFNVSFNISYLQLEDPNFVPAIIETVEKYEVDPSRIVVELTESVLAVDTVMVKNSFEILKKYGIQIALDDFGTGNSSFWMLHNIDVDIVKLDQSFIRGLDTSGTGIDYAIVESVGLMCNRIGCKTVAEGIETDAIWKMISKFNFMGLQGYLFSRPVEVPVFEELLEKYDMGLK